MTVKSNTKNLDTSKHASAFAEFDKVIKCLALELPEPVYDDVSSKYQNLKSVIISMLSYTNDKK